MRTILLGDVGNRLDIADTEREIAGLRQRQRTSISRQIDKEQKVLQLQDELARQKLAIQALTRFLTSKGLIQQSELDDFIREVDAEDGQIDGKMEINSESLRLQFPKMKKSGQSVKKAD